MGFEQNVNLYARLDRSGTALGALAWVIGAASVTVFGYVAIALVTWSRTADVEAGVAELSTSNVVVERRLAHCVTTPTRHETWRYRARSTC